MSARRVAVIGHVTPAPSAIDLPAANDQAKRLIELNNFTRVVSDDGKLVDHLAHLKQLRALPGDHVFTVWEMFLCASLLLASHLRRNGFEVEVINHIDSDNAPQAYQRLRAFAPEVVVLSTTFVLTRKHLTDIGTRLRRELPGAFIVAGGHHVLTTLMHMSEAQSTQYLGAAGFDGFVSDSQGEAALLQLCRCFPERLDMVPNLIWRRHDGTVVHNARVAEDNDINETLIDFDRTHQDAVVHIRTARSCGFKCAFCSYPTIAGELALMTLDNVMATLRQAKDCGVAAVVFVDDTFNVPPERFTALVERMIAEDIGIPWYSFLRCQYVDRELVSKMAKSGCAGVFLGVESGSDRILKNMKKGAIVGFYRDGVRWLREQGITTVGSFIVDFPGETPSTVAATQAFIETAGLDYYFIQPFYYLHHTPVHRRAKDYELTGEGLFWSHATMNWRQAIQHINRLFLEIGGSTFINPDYTLWEIAYLRSKGLAPDEIRRHRVVINEMTRKQMAEYGIAPRGVTSRVA